MRRRSFFSLLGGATAWVTTAPAQEPRRVIGVLGSASYGTFPGTEAAFIEGLRAAGFVEGKNIGIEWPKTVFKTPEKVVSYIAKAWCRRHASLHALLLLMRSQ